MPTVTEQSLITISFYRSDTLLASTLAEFQFLERFQDEDDEEETEEETGATHRIWLAPENLETSDGRIFLPGSIAWRSGPLPLTASDSEESHGDAIHVGNFDNIRKEDRNGVVWAVGDVTFDTDEDAIEFRRLVDERKLRGVSVHLAGMEAEVICTEQDDEGFCVDGLLEVTKAEIAAATIVLIPAFENAEIEPLAAALAAGHFQFDGGTAQQRLRSGVQIYSTGDWAQALESLPAFRVFENVKGGVELDAVSPSVMHRQPPREWFTNPHLPLPSPITITERGHVMGHLALWDTCHRGFGDVCVTPPRNGTAYEAFLANARVTCDDGTIVAVGCITMDGPHANQHLGLEATRAHYDNTTTLAAYITVGEDEHGIWYSGSVKPGIGDDQLENLRRLSLSGDWRPTAAGLELIAALAVPVPGFPTPLAVVASGVQTALFTYGPPPKTLTAAASREEQVFGQGGLLELLMGELAATNERLDAITYAVQGLADQRRAQELEAALATFEPHAPASKSRATITSKVYPVQAMKRPHRSKSTAATSKLTDV